jgi:hypothetical protein
VVAVENGGSLDLAGHTLAGAVQGSAVPARCTIGSTGTPGTIQDTEVTVGAGIAAVTRRRRVTLSNLVLINHYDAVVTDSATGKIYATDLTLTNNAIGMQARKIIITGLTASGQLQRGAIAEDRARRLDHHGEPQLCSQGRTVSLCNSTVTGSGGGIDLLTERRPRVFVRPVTSAGSYPIRPKPGAVCQND